MLFRRISANPLLPTLLLAGLIWLMPFPAAAAWYDSAWRYANPVSVDNAANSAALTNYPVRLALTSSSIDFSQAQQSGGDIRVTASDGTTLLNHWIESYSSSSQTASIYVRIPTLSAATSTGLYVYYGNGSATSTSNFGDTFSPTNYEDAFPQTAVSPGTKYESFPAAELLQNGDIIVAYRSATAHGLSSDGVVKLARSTDNGATWTASTILDFTASTTDTYVDLGMKQLSNGTILLPFNRQTTTTITMWITSSTDNGATWSTPYELTTASTTLAGTYGKIIELSTGKLLMPIEAQNPGEKVQSVLMESDDHGATWTYKAAIAASGSQDYSETAVVNIDDNNLVAVLRGDISGGVFAKLFIASSSDGGATWSAPTSSVTSRTYLTYGVSPDLIKLANGHLLLTIGNRYYGPVNQLSQKPHGISGYISTDNGATWSNEIPIYLGKRIEVPANGNIGYPSSIQLADGTIQTYYYHTLNLAGTQVRVDKTAWAENALDFTFADDLESGAATRWATIGSSTDISTTIVRDGTYSMKLLDQDTSVLNRAMARTFGVRRDKGMISFWMYPQTVVSFGMNDGEIALAGTTAYAFDLLTPVNGVAPLEYYPGGADDVAFSTPATVNLNEWTKIGLKYDNTTDRIETFVNDISHGYATRFTNGSGVDWLEIMSQSTAATGNTVYVDDVFAQPFAATEPSLTLSALLKEPTPPSGSLSIDGGAASTTAGQVALTISASDNFDATSAIQMQVSENSDFKDAVWQGYGTSLTHSLQAVPGTRTIYTRFKDSDGNISAATTAAITYNASVTQVGYGGPAAPVPAPSVPTLPAPVSQAPPPASPAPSIEKVVELKASLLVLMVQARQRGLTLPEGIGTLVGSSFTRDLSLRSMGEDVKLMQSVLIGAKTGSAGQRLSEAGATGFFGTLTYAALKEYQQKVGISPTGYFGPRTRGAWGF